MSRIRILSEQLANQIAAGEVIERPASVAKELVENSLDAGASRITLQVEGNGTGLLRAIDNGEGMDADDVLLCLERHATSKLRDEKQLFTINTLGFRGEALPSIASVSRLTILSRTAEAPTGTRAEVRFGTLQAIHEDGCARGTILEVRNLFGNVPARKKFLKTARTELFHIEEVIKNLSFAHPQVSFCLTVDNRTLLDLVAGQDLEKRTREIFRHQGPLLAISFSQSAPLLLKLTGYLLAPEHDTARGGTLRTLVNGRPVQDRTIRQAVLEGLRGFLPKGGQPAGVLLLELPPEQVDINVHPAKREVRFRDPRGIQQFFGQALAAALKSYQEEIRTEIFGSRQTLSVPEPSGVSAPAQPRPAAGVPQPAHPVSDRCQLDLISARRQTQPQPTLSTAEPSRNSRPAEFSPPPSAEALPPLPEPTAPEEPKPFEHLRLIGQLFQLYLLCEKDGQLLVIDQHAAHERILYQELRSAYLQRNLPSQALLFPVTVELSAEDADILAEHDKDFLALGLTAQHFGDSTWVIKSVPAAVAHLQPTEILIEIIEAFRGRPAGETTVIPTSLDALLASLACKAAIKAGNRLQPKEMLALLGRMEQSEIFSHCPHGRPVLKFIDKKEIEKWFQRS